MKYSLPVDTINKILAYLGSKTFTEVNQLIQEIQTLAAVVEEKKDPPKETDGSVV